MTRVPRIFCAVDLSPGRELRLPETQAHHLLRVLRLGAGDTVRVFDGDGSERLAVISHARGSTAAVRIGPAIDSVPESPLRICLLQGVGRGERMDWVIQKATELGVQVVRPVLTARCVVKLRGDRAQKRLRHWQAIAIAACEQCGRSRVPEIRPPAALSDALGGHGDPEPRIVLDAAEGGPMNEVAPAGDGLTLLVGPEGGLTPEEKADARRRGFVPVRLGPRVMRTETAAVAALVSAQTLWGDLSASRTTCPPA